MPGLEVFHFQQFRVLISKKLYFKHLWSFAPISRKTPSEPELLPPYFMQFHGAITHPQIFCRSWPVTGFLT